MIALVALAIFSTWILCAAILTGIGALLLRSLRLESSAFDAFWAGLFSTVACLQLYQFFRPVDAILAELLCLVAICGAIFNREVFMAILRRAVGYGFLRTGLVLTPILVIAVRCAGPVVHYDTGFYGSMAVRWLTTYPLVPGLTNLFDRLGLNSSVFLCVAALDQGPWSGLGFHLFVGFLLSAITLIIADSFLRAFFAGCNSPLINFVVLFAVPAIVWALNGEIVGTNTDLPTTFVCLAGMMALFKALQEKQSAESAAGRAESGLVVAMMLFTLAITFKISSLAFAGLGWGMAFFQLLSLEETRIRKRQLIVAATLLSGAVAIPWVVRGVVQSGYPFFPSSAFAVPVDWRVPRAAADLLAHIDRSWARIPHAGFEETSGLRWIRPWLAIAIKDRADFLIPALISFLGAVFLLRRKRAADIFWLELLLVSLGGLAFWFLLAPAFRFGEAAIWTTAASLGAVALQEMMPRMSQTGKRVVLIGILGLGGWSSYPRTLWRVHFRRAVEVPGFLHEPAPKTIPYTLSSGLTIKVPVETSQCWDAPVPCSPSFSDNLELRQAGVLRWGFRVRGPETEGSLDKFTALHLKYMKKPPKQEVCMNCHLEAK